MLDPTLVQRIRAIFPHPAPHVTIGEAAAILGWSRAQRNAAVRNGEIEVVATGGGKRIETRELAAWALQEWAVTTIEDALGRDAGGILPPPLRTRRLTVRLPRYQAEALKLLAEDARESVDAVLTRAVEDLAARDRARFSRLVPGFADAIAWPETGEEPPACGSDKPAGQNGIPVPLRSRYAVAGRLARTRRRR